MASRATGVSLMRRGSSSPGLPSRVAHSDSLMLSCYRSTFDDVVFYIVSLCLLPTDLFGSNSLVVTLTLFALFTFLAASLYVGYVGFSGTMIMRTILLDRTLI